MPYLNVIQPVKNLVSLGKKDFQNDTQSFAVKNPYIKLIMAIGLTKT